MKITLAKPITAHGEEITEIELREPTGGDVIDLGQPMNINSNESFSFNMEIIAKYVVRLGAVPMSSVRDMTPSDVMQCAVAVSGFFGEMEAG